MARTPIHPGEVLKDELDELGIGASELARQIEVAQHRLPRFGQGEAHPKDQRFAGQPQAIGPAARVFED